MLKSTLYLLVACCLLVSCDDYEWDTKMIVEGRVVDHNGNPMTNIDVSIKIDYVYQGTALFGNWGPDSEIISYTKTDTGGWYKMMFPRPKDEDDILLLINADKNKNPLNTIYSSTVIYNIKQENFNDYLVNFGEHKIFPIENVTQLQIATFDDPGFFSEITNVNIDGLAEQNLIDYNFGSDSLQYLFFQQAYTVATNQTLLVKYTIRTEDPNGPVYTTTEVPVQIGTQPVSYTINY